jgi:hypothetical protein
MPVSLGYANRSDAATLSGGSFDATHTRARMQDQRMRYAARTANCKRSSTWFRGVFTANYTVRALAIGYHNCTRYGRMRVRAGRSPFDLIFDSEDTGGILDERLTKSGGNNGTRVNKSGIIVPVTRTNLILRSAEFDNVAWARTNLAVTAAAIETPESTTTDADKLDEGSATGAHSTSQTFSATSGVTYCLSMYVKQGTKRYVQLSFATASHGANAYANFDLTDGAVGEVGSAVLRANITPEGKGWWRVVMVAPATSTTASATADLHLVANTSATRAASYTGANQYIYVWGAQLEEGGDATTYIPTTSATASSTESGRINYGTFRTNLVKHSANYSRSDWTKSGVSASVADIAAYDGGACYRFVEDTSGGHSFQQIVSNQLTTATFTLSGYFKAGEKDRLRLQIAGTAGNFVYANFNLTSGAVVGSPVVGGTGVSSGASVSSVGDGWYRCIVSGSPGTGTAVSATVNLLNSGYSGVYAGDGVSGLYAADLQLEQSASVSAYIETTYWPRTVVDACNGLLVEEVRTNMLVRSAEFDNASWVNGGGGVTANNVLAPNGTQSGDMLTLAGAGSGLIYQLVTVTASTAYTFSVYAKMGTVAEADYKLAFYDATAGAFIVSDVVPTGTSVGNGWKRYSYTVTTPVGCVSMRAYAFRNAALTTGTLYFWGAQLELGVFATSYIPTTSASVARTADSATVAGSNFTGIFNAVEGTLYVEAAVPATTTDAASRVNVAVGDSTTINEAMYVTRPVSSADVRVTINDGGVAQWASNTLGTATAGTAYKAVFAYKANDLAGTLNGGAINADAAGTIPTCDVLAIGNGSWSGASNHLNECVRRCTYWPERLKNSELISITTSGPDVIGYNSGWVDALQFEFNSDTASTWGTKYNLLAYMSSAVTAGYFTVEIDDQYITDSYLMLGRLAVMTSLAPTEDANIAGWRESREELSTVSKSESGRLFANERPRPRSLDFALPALTQTEADHVHEIQDLCGITDEILLIPDTADMAYSQRYGGIGFLRELTALEYFNDANDRRSTAFRWQEKL